MAPVQLNFSRAEHVRSQKHKQGTQEILVKRALDWEVTKSWFCTWFHWGFFLQPQLSDPHNRNHKSLAIANHNFEVASFFRRNRSEIAVSEVFSESQWFFWVLRLQSLAICDSKSLRFGSLRTPTPTYKAKIFKAFRVFKGCPGPNFG